MAVVAACCLCLRGREPIGGRCGSQTPHVSVPPTRTTHPARMHNTIPTYHRVRGVLNARALAHAALARRRSATLKASALCALALCGSAGTARATELVVQGAGWGHGV